MKKPSDRLDAKPTDIEPQEKHEERREEQTSSHTVREENRKEDQGQKNIDHPEKVETTFLYLSRSSALFWLVIFISGLKALIQPICWPSSQEMASARHDG